MTTKTDGVNLSWIKTEQTKRQKLYGGTWYLFIHPNDYRVFIFQAVMTGLDKRGFRVHQNYIISDDPEAGNYIPNEGPYVLIRTIE